MHAAEEAGQISFSAKVSIHAAFASAQVIHAADFAADTSFASDVSMPLMIPTVPLKFGFKFLKTFI